ncbi:hypothetical protein HanPI659440_Chr08g0303151 [Helianthus annuus]|nr:hypothetical protein HanPI659440_Chr08g0303151 [Helianthus annuus]
MGMGGPQSVGNGEKPPSVNVDQPFNVDLSSFGSISGGRAQKGRKTKKVVAQKFFLSDSGEPSKRKRKRMEYPFAEISDLTAPGDNRTAEDNVNDEGGFRLDLNIRAVEVEANQPTGLDDSSGIQVRPEVNLEEVPPSVVEKVNMEVEETIEIGKVVGANLEQHRELIKEIIGEEGLQPGKP